MGNDTSKIINNVSRELNRQDEISRSKEKNNDKLNLITQNENNNLCPGFNLIHENNITQLEILLESADEEDIEKYFYNCTNKLGDTILFFAIRMKNIKAVEILINKGFNVEFKNNDGDTPFHFAIKNSNTPLEIINIFLSKTTNFNIQNNKGETLLM